MTAIWHKGSDTWRQLTPAPFSAEADLHDLVEEAPQLLPLSGSPALVVIGREVRLGGGYADLIAVDPTGQLAIIEVKLAANDEARRAVVAQVLAYAAFLDHMSYADFEDRVMRPHLTGRGHPSLAAAAETAAPGTFDPQGFRDTLSHNLGAGRFRLVLVLDRVPPELTRLVGYLEGMSQDLGVDLLGVSAYHVADQVVLVPYRVDPERRPYDLAATAAAQSTTTEHEGSEFFERGINSAPEEQQPDLRRLLAWARSLERDSQARLVSAEGRTTRVLRLYVPGRMSIAVLYHDRAGGSVNVYRSMLHRWAPHALAELETLVGADRVGVGTKVPASDEVLKVLSAAYAEASGGLGDAGGPATAK